MTNFVLLTGAGFSRNWGGWLADEVMEYLLGCPELDAHVRSLLWKQKGKGGFEAVLGALRNSQSQLHTLEKAISGMFDLMNAAFGAEFEFQSDLRYQVATFLARFDAIFTLNQDLLIEQFYLANNDVSLRNNSKWDGAGIPGIRPHRAETKPLDPPLIGPQIPDSSGLFQISPRIQPYLKLHGSCNWRDEGGRNLLIMGEDKTAGIGRNKLLSFYWQTFEAYLRRPETRLMIVGYGFRDQHVNKSLGTAARGGGLRAFVIDPYGVDALDTHRDPQTLIKPQPDQDLDALRHQLIGASRRPLSAIFGRDTVEHAKTMRFFH